MKNHFSKLLVATTLLSLASIAIPVPVKENDVLACRDAYKQCKFHFDGLSKITTFPLQEDIHVSFSARITSKKKGESVGHVYSKGFVAEVIKASGAVELSQFGGENRVPDNGFNSYALQGVTGSGIQNQALLKSHIMALRHKCIRMYFSSYQILYPNGSVKDTVMNLGLSDKYCVVFRTDYANRKQTDAWPAVDVFV